MKYNIMKSNLVISLIMIFVFIPVVYSQENE